MRLIPTQLERKDKWTKRLIPTQLLKQITDDFMKHGTKHYPQFFSLMSSSFYNFFFFLFTDEKVSEKVKWLLSHCQPTFLNQKCSLAQNPLNIDIILSSLLSMLCHLFFTSYPFESKHMMQIKNHFVYRRVFGSLIPVIYNATVFFTVE